MVASWACEVTEILTQKALKTTLLCEDYSNHGDLTSPTSNKILDMHKTVSVIYDTLKKYFSFMRVHIVTSFILTVRWNWVYFFKNLVSILQKKTPQPPQKVTSENTVPKKSQRTPKGGTERGTVLEVLVILLIRGSIFSRKF